jgi:hypothetical protein
VRTIAVDWSGRRTNAGAAIRLAETSDGRLVRLEGGRNRRELILHLVQEAERDPELVAGLDFAFSFPRSFVERHAGGVFEFWDVVAREGEQWLDACEPPFWRARGSPRPAPTDALRETDRGIRVGGIRPESVFKLVGATQVGPGSVRGIPFLAELRSRGFAIWPFDDVRLPAVVEIWPRVLTDAVAKSRRAERVARLRQFPEIDDALRDVAATTDDAFDAAVSSVVMWRHRDELVRLESEPGNVEGRIWRPRAGLHWLT